MKVAMILLSAGKGSRFGKNKLETYIGKNQIIEYVLSNIPVESLYQVVMVASTKSMLDTAKRYGISGIINDRPDDGIARSIRMGTECVKDADAYIYCVSDQPLLKKTTIENMIKKYKSGTILALAIDRKRGNPVIFPSFLYDELVSLQKGESGQKVINAHLDILKHYETSDASELMDIDTKEDFDIIKLLIGRKH